MSQTFSVLSYNIQAAIGTMRAHHYVTRAHQHVLSTKAKTQRLRTIGKYLAGFDVVCLQEVDLGGRRAGFSNQVDLLQEASQHAHAVWQENRTIRRISRHGNAILSRAAILSCEDVKLPGRVGGRGALVVELDMDPATVLICAHLSLGEGDQTAQMDHIAEVLDAPKYHRARKILCGDLNCGPNSLPITSFAEASSLRPLTDSSHKSYPSWAPRLALDHILTTDHRHEPQVRVEDAQWSDHRPVSAEFRVTEMRG